LAHTQVTITWNSCYSIKSSHLGVHDDVMEKDGKNDLTQGSRYTVHLYWMR